MRAGLRCVHLFPCATPRSTTTGCRECAHDSFEARCTVVADARSGRLPALGTRHRRLHGSVHCRQHMWRHAVLRGPRTVALVAHGQRRVHMHLQKRRAVCKGARFFIEVAWYVHSQWCCLSRHATRTWQAASRRSYTCTKTADAGAVMATLRCARARGDAQRWAMCATALRMLRSHALSSTSTMCPRC